MGATKALAKRLNFDDLHFSGASAGAITATNAAIWGGDNEKREMELILEFQRVARSDSVYFLKLYLDRKFKFTNEMQHRIRDMLDELYPTDVASYMGKGPFWLKRNSVSFLFKMGSYFTICMNSIL